MRNFFTILFAGFFTIGLSAQTDKGTFIIGLNTGLGFSSTNTTDIEGIGGDWDDVYDKQSSSTLNFNLTDFSALLESVKLGYFVADNFAIALGLIYSSDGSNDDYVSDINGLGQNDEKSTTTTFVIEPALRYYMEMGEGFLFGQLSYGIGSITSKVELSEQDDPDDSVMKASGLGLGIGYSILVNDNISIEPTLGYSMLTETEVDAGMSSTGSTADQVKKSNTLSFGIGLTMLLY
jgi:opacity protein-like surface antigen